MRASSGDLPSNARCRRAVSVLLLAAALFIGSGCQERSGGELSSTPPVDQSDAAPYFIAYSEVQYRGALAEGRAILIFFPSGGSGGTLRSRIQEVIMRMDIPVAGFSANDRETALKKSFNVAYPNTVIILDGNGQETIRFTGAESPSYIENALRKANEVQRAVRSE